ncbi:ABC transporter ATP-binding protein [Haloferax sp. YSMS24]|uniref:ABC transporter ATP-binding protein n=1 Tax=Haloferax sp. YSMS24 TaxID=3388425 RepID=UPI00398C947E
MAPRITVENVSKRYGNGVGGVRVLEDISFEVEDGEFLVLVGPSGCGKTTLLKALAGLVEPSSGFVGVDGAPVDGPSDDVAMVFQDFLLLPWMTVLENVAMGLKVQEGMAAGPRREVAREWIDRIGLGGFENHYPSTLSGGMKQRVGLARALAVRPDVLLLDEPFGSVDAQTKHELQAELMELWNDEQKTVVFVTHDIDEAAFLADRVLVLSSSPATVVGEVEVDIDRPRWNRRLEVEGSDAFARTKQYVYDTIGLTHE